MTTAEEILARRAEESRILLEAQRERQAEARRREREYRESLPRLAYEAAGDPRPGVAYVICTEPAIMAFDGRRVWQAAVRGDWLEESRARVLGLGGPAIVLVATRE